MRKTYILIIGLLLIIISSSCSNNSYSLDDWKANKSRAKQIKSLIKSQILIGKSYEEVIRMLGTEKLVDMWRDSLGVDKEFMIRYLTGETSFAAFEFLQIQFKSGKAVRVERTYD